MCGACNDVIAEARGRKIHESKKKKSSKSSFTKNLMKLGGAALGYGAGYTLGASIPKAPGLATVGGAMLGSGAGYIGGGKLYDYMNR